MWETVSTFLIKYWAEFLLGLIAAGISLFIKRFFILNKEEKQRQQDERYKELFKESQKENEEERKIMNEQYLNMYNEFKDTIQIIAEASKREDVELQDRINRAEENYSLLKNGMLSVQRKGFIHECKRLLDPEHIITLEEWEDLTEDHNVYNSLGGNHKGDEYYNLVLKKVEDTLLK